MNSTATRGPAGRRAGGRAATPAARRGGPQRPGAPRLAPWLALAVAALAVVGARAYFTGAGAVAVDADDPQAQTAAAMLAQIGEVEAPPRAAAPTGAPAAELAGQAPSLPQPQPIASSDGLVLRGADHLPRAVPAEAQTGFARLQAADVGFAPAPMPAWYETMVLGLNEFAPLAAGDINSDGWPDVAVGTAAGVQLHVNTGARFALQDVGVDELASWTVTTLALVDLDGDAGPDLVACGWMQGCRILFNRDGAFSADAQVALPRGTERATRSLAFADLDRDGRLEVLTGPGSGLGWNFSPTSTVTVWRPDADGRYTPQVLDGPGGEALTLLVTDVDDDGWPDLYVGNDFDEPDLLYRNDGGTLRLATGADNPFPLTTESTMSADTGDLDNDGTEELYLAAISYGAIDRAELDARSVAPHRACELSYGGAGDELRRCQEQGEFATAVVRSRDITDVGECRHFADDPVRRRDCVAAGYLFNAAFVTLPSQGADRRAVAERCSRFPAALDKLHDLCEVVDQAPLDYAQAHKALPGHAEQRTETNLLLARSGDGFADATERWGAAYGGWSWNARFADVDNDTWQDLFVAQGTRLRFRAPSNLLYRNDAGAGLTEVTALAGLTEHVPTGASLFVDYDLDGRLDIITHPFALAPVLWRNDVAPARSVVVALHDRTAANTAAVGARVELISDDGRSQVRQIKASGGFTSDDPKVATFGLGDWPGVEAVTVTWPDGSTDRLAVDELPPGRYTLERQP